MRKLRKIWTVTIKKTVLVKTRRIWMMMGNRTMMGKKRMPLKKEEIRKKQWNDIDITFIKIANLNT